MTYYRGTTPYPHPEDPTKVLCYIRNRLGWRVVVSPEDGARIKPYDLFQDRAGQIQCKTIMGKQFLLSSLNIPHTLFRHVAEWVDPLPKAVPLPTSDAPRPETH